MKLIIFVVIFFCCSTANIESIASEKLKKAALEQLHSTLSSNFEWEKVHAAEFLLNLGYPENVYETFLKEEEQKGDEIYYRIGIWRVLAQASLKSEDKQHWIDSIASVFSSPNSP